MQSKWIVTDPDTGQQGRKIKDWVYEFKEGTAQATIDLEDFLLEYIEEVLQGYGYSLCPFKKDYILDIYKNKETANWIIAECIFEQTM